MSAAQKVIDESRPMLVEVLREIGLHKSDQQLDLQALLEPFSHWVEAQDVRPKDTAFLLGLIGAFICEFLIECHSATRLVREGRILLQIPIQEGIWQEFDPYAVAYSLAQRRGNVALFIRELTS
jgi:hypothetical protein